MLFLFFDFASISSIHRYDMYDKKTNTALYPIQVTINLFVSALFDITNCIPYIPNVTKNITRAIAGKLLFLNYFPSINKNAYNNIAANNTNGFVKSKIPISFVPPLFILIKFFFN